MVVQPIFCEWQIFPDLVSYSLQLHQRGAQIRELERRLRQSEALSLDIDIVTLLTGHLETRLAFVRI